MGFVVRARWREVPLRAANQSGSTRLRSREVPLRAANQSGSTRHRRNRPARPAFSLWNPDFPDLKRCKGWGWLVRAIFCILINQENQDSEDKCYAASSG